MNVLFFGDSEIIGIYCNFGFYICNALKSFATGFTVLMPVYWRQILSTLIIVLFVFNPR